MCSCNHKRVSDAPDGERDAAQRGGCQRAGEPGNDDAIVATLAEAEDFFAATAKYKRIASFEAHDAFVDLQSLDACCVDLFLRLVSPAIALLRDPHFCACTASKLEDVLRDEAVCYNELCSHEMLESRYRHELDVARARADESNLKFRKS